MNHHPRSTVCTVERDEQESLGRRVHRFASIYTTSAHQLHGQASARPGHLARNRYQEYLKRLNLDGSRSEVQVAHNNHICDPSAISIIQRLLTTSMLDVLGSEKKVFWSLVPPRPGHEAWLVIVYQD